MFFSFHRTLGRLITVPQLLTGLGAARIKQTQRNTLHIKPSRSSRQYSPHNKLSQMIYAGRHIPPQSSMGCVFLSPLTLILATTAYFSAYNVDVRIPGRGEISHGLKKTISHSDRCQGKNYCHVDHLLFIGATVNDFALSAFRMTIKEHVFSLHLRF